MVAAKTRWCRTWPVGIGPCGSSSVSTQFPAHLLVTSYPPKNRPWQSPELSLSQHLPDLSTYRGSPPTPHRLGKQIYAHPHVCWSTPMTNLWAVCIGFWYQPSRVKKFPTGWKGCHSLIAVLFIADQLLLLDHDIFSYAFCTQTFDGMDEILE